MAEADLLRDVLELARKEKALEGDALVAFATALRERARIVLAERIEPLEARIRMLEDHARSVDAENAWRREAMSGLEEEGAWRREAMAGLEERVRGLEVELATLARDHEKATRAHGELVAHHRSVVRQVIEEALAVAALPWIHVRQARRRLTSLAQLLRPEAP